MRVHSFTSFKTNSREKDSSSSFLSGFMSFIIFISIYVAFEIINMDNAWKVLILARVDCLFGFIRIKFEKESLI